MASNSWKGFTKSRSEGNRRGGRGAYRGEAHRNTDKRSTSNVGRDASGRGGQSAHGEKKPVSPVGNNWLEDRLTEMYTPNQLAMSVNTCRGFWVRSEQCITEVQIIRMIIQVIIKCLQSSYSECGTEILIKLTNGEFVAKNIPNYVMHLYGDLRRSKLTKCKEEFGVIENRLVEVVTLLTLLVDRVSSISLGQVTSAVYGSLESTGIVDDLCKELAGCHNSDLASLTERLKITVDDFNKRSENAQGNKTYFVALHKTTLQPPNDFREISIFPTSADINDTQPFLRENVVKGEYIDEEHYLDVQFRLLREDFVRPLREGILEYRDMVTRGEKSKKLQDVRIYDDVCIVKPICKLDLVLYQINFDARHLRRLNWAASKRLMYGSLVCLSADNFDTLLFAIVQERESETLNKMVQQNGYGFIFVKFETAVPDDYQTRCYTMVESNSYFEAYRPVLESLQRIRVGDVPAPSPVKHSQPMVLIKGKDGRIQPMLLINNTPPPPPPQ